MIKALKSVFGDKNRTIAVTSPAGYPAREKLLAEISDLRAAGFAVKEFLPERSKDTPDYLAASAGERIRQFNLAVNDPEVDLILCSRGGFGCVHILDELDYDCLRKRNMPVMGYSDITALHCAMLSRHAGTAIAGSNLLNLHKILMDDFSRQSHAAALNNTCGCTLDLPQNLQLLKGNDRNLSVSAHAYAANLTVLASLCGSEYLPDFENMILILEDINEPLYKLDRMLHQLLLNGIFDKLAALFFADFSGSTDKPEELDGLFMRIAGKLSIPCFKGFPFGHTLPMCAVNSILKMNLLLPGKIHFSLD